jgi:glutathione synthase/RimK-type ligase-like ATP-grasp enzyme
VLEGIAGVEIPATTAVTREQLLQLSPSADTCRDIAADLAFPVIVRPRGSHAGAGLARLDDDHAIRRYLDARLEQEFFIARFVDYSNRDGLFRKYRIVFIDGRPYACHMAIADRWDIWYLNAGMSLSASKRLEEQAFMQTFDVAFARRHAVALAEISNRIGLDYFTVDCAETKDGSLLIFEADNTAIVHDMDPPDIFPYKVPQMRKVFDAFAAMLDRYAGQRRERAA